MGLKSYIGSRLQRVKRKLLVIISRISKPNYFGLISGVTPALPMSAVETKQIGLGSCCTCKLIPSSSPETLRSDSKVSGEQQCSVCPYTCPESTNTTNSAATSIIAVISTKTCKLIPTKSSSNFSINF